MFENFLSINSDIGLSSSLVFLSLLWVLPWKGVALWKAARNGQKKWFIFMFVINTMALLEIVYIFYFAKKQIKHDSGQCSCSDKT